MNFERTDIGMGVLTPGGITWRSHHGAFEFPPGSGNDHGASILAELDAIKDDIADHNRLTAPIYRQRRMPEGAGIWVTMSLTSTSGGSGIPDDQTMWGLTHRGVVPAFQIDAPGVRMSGLPGAPDEGRYVGAPALGGIRATPVGCIPTWSAAHPGRNFAQRILDGDYDPWIDSLASRVAGLVGLVDPSTGAPNPAANLKGMPYTDYERVIVRPFFEMNGRTLHQSLPWADQPAGSRARGIQEFNAAWCHLVDRVRVTNGASNASFFWCFVHATDAFRGRPANYLPSRNGGGAAGDAALRARIDFLGLDSYDANGDGIDGKLLLDRNGAAGPGDLYIAVFEDFGATQKRMLVGEWGTTLGHQGNVVGDPPALVVPDRRWDCSVGATGSANERCRGRWIARSGIDIVRKRAGDQGDRNKWRALKGLFYMARDLSVDDVWGLWRDTATSYGSTAAEGPWPAEPDPDPRPSLGAGIPGSDEFSFARYAKLLRGRRYRSEFRGRGGAFWDP